jgi:hypothetical protein
VYVLVRKDVYERLKGLVYNDTPWTAEEMNLLAAEDADALRWQGTDAYAEPSRSAVPISGLPASPTRPARGASGDR